MSTTQQTEDKLNALVHDKGWKGHVTIGVIALILWALLSSALFLVIKFLIELILLVGGIILVGYGLYEYFQAKEAKEKGKI